MRCRKGTVRWISARRSHDNANAWTHENDPVEYLREGNPPMLNKLRDGRLCLTCGFRAYPYSIRARLSTDNGKTWGPQIVLREDGADRDIGYVRSVQRPDGKIVTVYYISDEETGPERHIGATIWDPTRSPGLPVTSREAAEISCEAWLIGCCVDDSQRMWQQAFWHLTLSSFRWPMPNKSR